MIVENFEHIDEIIRQKFENFEPEPPLQVWENVRSAINQNPPPTPSGLMLPILFIVTFLMFTGSLLLNLLTGTSENHSGDNPVSESYLKSAGMFPTGSTTETGKSLQEAIYDTYQVNHLDQTVADAAPAQPIAEEIRVKAPFQPVPANRPNDASAVRTTSPSAKTGPDRGTWTPGLRQALNSGEISVATAVKYNLSKKDVQKLSGYQDYARGKKATWSIGAYFNPDVTMFRSEELENTVSYSLGLMPQVTFNHFFIQSGISARFTHDKGNSQVSYNRFLGTYEDVYLVTFDSTEFGVVPTYFTETVEVFDTVDHYTVTETSSDYTYLEVPVQLGYIHDFGKVSLFAKGGPSASFLIRKNMPVQAPETGARIVDVDYQVPARSTVNWQLVLGAGLNYEFSDQVSFTFEPTFRHALKSEYQLSGGAKTGANSFGIRVGLNYHF